MTRRVLLSMICALFTVFLIGCSGVDTTQGEDTGASVTEDQTSTETADTEETPEPKKTTDVPALSEARWNVGDADCVMSFEYDDAGYMTHRTYTYDVDNKTGEKKTREYWWTYGDDHKLTEARATYYVAAQGRTASQTLPIDTTESHEDDELVITESTPTKPVVSNEGMFFPSTDTQYVYGPDNVIRSFEATNDYTTAGEPYFSAETTTYNSEGRLESSTSRIQRTVKGSEVWREERTLFSYDEEYLDVTFEVSLEMEDQPASMIFNLTYTLDFENDNPVHAVDNKNNVDVTFSYTTIAAPDPIPAANLPNGAYNQVFNEIVSVAHSVK